VPIIQISPSEGMPGMVVTIQGQRWKADESLIIELEDPSGTCSPMAVLMPIAGPDGYFRSLLSWRFWEQRSRFRGFFCHLQLDDDSARHNRAAKHTSERKGMLCGRHDSHRLVYTRQVVLSGGSTWM